MPDCWASLPDRRAGDGAPAGSLQARIRAGGGAAGAEEFVVVGAATGYAGRAVATQLAAGALPVTAHSFVLTSEDEAPLRAACPATAFPFPLDPLDADPCLADACRGACEQLAVAWRARRTHLTSVACHRSSSSSPVTHCETYFPQFVRPGASTDPFPPPAGPTLAFSLGLQCKAGGAPTGCTPDQDTPSERDLVRDTRIELVTRSGWSPAARYGGGANGGPATLPTGGAYLDRTGATPDEAARFDRRSDRYRFFVPYVGNLVLDLSPGQTSAENRVLR
jgi:hypothetical protein